ncbi:hypothetical protein M405DRAFT_906358 [Rhizopogon salebrosus TDB-379]|nr:hypothetical protein M405DRAFT_906358 [Rhizopogon salebrosus TDB-379]
MYASSSNHRTRNSRRMKMNVSGLGSISCTIEGLVACAMWQVTCGDVCLQYGSGRTDQPSRIRGDAELICLALTQNGVSVDEKESTFDNGIEGKCCQGALSKDSTSFVRNDELRDPPEEVLTERPRGRMRGFGRVEGSCCVTDKAFSETDIISEVMADLHDATHGQLGEHDNLHYVGTDSVRNGVCLKLSVKDRKQKRHGIPELIETANNVSEVFD